MASHFTAESTRYIMQAAINQRELAREHTLGMKFSSVFSAIQKSAELGHGYCVVGVKPTEVDDFVWLVERLGFKISTQGYKHPLSVTLPTDQQPTVYEYTVAW